jgi:hypothetical protein
MAEFLKEVINNDVDPLFVRYDEIRTCRGEIGAEAIRRYNKTKNG